MKGTSIGASVAALVGAAALPAGTATTAVVRRSDQDGLVNVNLQSPQRAIPVSGAVPVDAAASVRGVDVPTRPRRCAGPWPGPWSGRARSGGDRGTTRG